MIRTVSGAVRAALVVAALSLGLGPALAQQQDFSDAKLDSFVEAAIQVEQLITEWSPKIEGAADQTAADEMRQEANAELEAAIEATDGITVNEYQEIAAAARANPDLSERLKDIYQQKLGG